MELSKTERLSLYTFLKNELSGFSEKEIEDGVMIYCLNDYGYKHSTYDNNENASMVSAKLTQFNLPTDLETITEFFESLLEKDHKDENGIVFTPQYIANYITSTAISSAHSNFDNTSIIDPGCGCGIFLITAAEMILSSSNKSIDSIIENNIFGIDVIEDNVRRCKLMMKLLSAKYGGNFETVKPNIICNDSLKINWAQTFGVDAFNYIIGNPPYVNPHDMNKDTVKFLKKNFTTTKNGVFNIFYAFIEQGMKFLTSDGVLSFIVPNNFLTIKSALELREYLKNNQYIKRILDFGDNMVFKPIRTYNCIIQLSKTVHSKIEYCVLSKTEDIQNAITKIVFNSMSIDSLDKNGWKLVDEKTYRNLRIIENQFVSIKSFIRTGIATLRDGVYLVEKDQDGYYKLLNGEKMYIESGLVKPIYKVPDLKLHNCVDDAKRYIIFPYIKTNNGYTLIDENDFVNDYPNTYNCLLLQRDELDARDKGKGALQGWYAYGRTQGLNKYGRKLLFPTFASSPKFLYVDDEDALFCNGYAVFENDYLDLDILIRVLNSRLMDYYVSNTSYSIEGGYYCYQKKYVERFSLPLFSDDQITFIRSASKSELDDFLWALYGLK